MEEGEQNAAYIPIHPYSKQLISQVSMVLGETFVLCCIVVLHKESKFHPAVADLHGLCSMVILQKKSKYQPAVAVFHGLCSMAISQKYCKFGPFVVELQWSMAIQHKETKFRPAVADLHGLCSMAILHMESKFQPAVADLHGLCSMAILHKETNPSLLSLICSPCVVWRYCTMRVIKNIVFPGLVCVFTYVWLARLPGISRGFGHSRPGNLGTFSII